MKYIGSKLRISKDLLDVILRDRKENQWYIEPFVGGGNMIQNVTGNRIGSDIDEYAIEALKLIRDNPESLPICNNTFNEEYYKMYKSHTNKGLSGYVGYALSFGGKFYGGYRRDSIGTRDYVREAYNSAQKQSLLIKDVILKVSDYKSLYLPENSLIYCDPPYKNTTGYRNKFNTDSFFEWCREKSKHGHKVFISEYEAPEDFIEIWKKEKRNELNKDITRTEKLFMYKGVL